ncbi:hypothetical protein CBOM_05210 [Ceraceosorus bombacis]|uniref:Uncharacterized protein n=1 Tax=Ceraceosorus bombacis TaxID=401625 RepID=A0A0P1BRC0_9BASI|nr:hypothetical protein CBOM_05210 [Ceraceosorus bombacis]
MYQPTSSDKDPKFCQHDSTPSINTTNTGSCNHAPEMQRVRGLTPAPTMQVSGTWVPSSNPIPDGQSYMRNSGKTKSEASSGQEDSEPGGQYHHHGKGTTRKGKGRAQQQGKEICPVQAPSCHLQPQSGK